MTKRAPHRRMLAAFAACFHQDLDIENDEVYGGDPDRWLAEALGSQFWIMRGVEDAGGWTIDRVELKCEIRAFLGEHASDAALTRAWIQLGGESSLPNVEPRQALREIAESL